MDTDFLGALAARRLSPGADDGGPGGPGGAEVGGWGPGEGSRRPGGWHAGSEPASHPGREEDPEQSDEGRVHGDGPRPSAAVVLDGASEGVAHDLPEGGETMVTSCRTSGGSSRRRAVARISSSTCRCRPAGVCRSAALQVAVLEDEGGEGDSPGPDGGDLRSIVDGGLGVLDSGKLATSLLTLRERIEPKVLSGDTSAPAEATRPLTDPSVTKKGKGVGQGEGGAEDTLERLLETVECGHLGVGASRSALLDRPHHGHGNHRRPGVRRAVPYAVTGESG